MNTTVLESGAYHARRAWIAEYFDRTAADRWAQLTSEAPVSRIRATVRAGRDRMRATLLGWLPRDLRRMRVLDAGCGTGALAVELARRGADVVATDLSPTLVSLARDRTPAALRKRIAFRTGEMLDASLGDFDYVVAMDSLIHYRAAEIVAALESLAPRVRSAVLFTVAPRTTLLALMHAVGRVLPGAHRAPAIEPIRVPFLRGALSATLPAEWALARQSRVAGGFYTSEAFELRHVRGAIQEPEETLE